MGLVDKIIFVAGILSLIHTAYSSAEYRTKMRVTEQEYESLPTDILLQGLVSLVVTMFGILGYAGDFKEIRATKQLSKKSWETVGNRPSFYSFNHRGKFLNSEYSSSFNSMESLGS